MSKNTNFRAATSGDTLTLYVYDDIGPEWAGMVSAETFVAELDKFHGGTVNVRINSPGGDVDQSLAIYNSLIRQPAHVVVDIDGMAASAASVVAMAGDKIRVAKSAVMMIHDPWSVISGNAKELRKSADVLDKLGKILAEIYSARSGLGLATVQRMMADETWFNASEAVARGLADEVGQGLQTVASARVAANRYRNTPAALIDRKSKSFSRNEEERQARLEQLKIDCGLAPPRDRSDIAAMREYCRIQKELYGPK